jgi:F1F0 ATPase subunit 2
MDAPVMSDLAAALPYLVAGAALGLLHFGALAWNVALLVGDGRRWLGALVLAARLAITAAVFVLVARYGGALPLMFAAAGFAVARPLLVRRAKVMP